MFAYHNIFMAQVTEKILGKELAPHEVFVQMCYLVVHILSEPHMSRLIPTEESYYWLISVRMCNAHNLNIMEQIATTVISVESLMSASWMIYSTLI